MKIALLTAAALSLVGVAHAAEFSAPLTGSGTRQFTNPMDTIGLPGGCDPVGDPYSQACMTGVAPVPWTGTLTVTTSGAADGTYAYGSGIEAISLTSNWGGFVYRLGDPYQQVDGFPGSTTPLLWVGLEPGAHVTIQNGKLGGVWATDDDWTLQFVFQGLDASMQSVNGGHDVSETEVSGSLAPVPESPTGLTLLGGLVLLAVRRAPRRSLAGRGWLPRRWPSAR